MIPINRGREANAGDSRQKNASDWAVASPHSLASLPFDPVPENGQDPPPGMKTLSSGFPSLAALFTNFAKPVSSRSTPSSAIS